MCLWHVDFIYQLVFFIMSTSRVDLFLCVMLTSLVDFMTFVISTQFVGLPFAMLDYVILAWFSRCSFSLVIYVDQLPLHGESSWNEDIPSGASLFSPFGCNLVGSKLLCLITPTIYPQIVIWIVVLLLHLGEHYFFVPI